MREAIEEFSKESAARQEGIEDGGGSTDNEDESMGNISVEVNDL
jgi:hypothetical protein